MQSAVWKSAVLATCLVYLPTGCESESDPAPACEAAWPGVPEDAPAARLYVSHTCGDAGTDPDGSQAAPFGTISAAIAAASGATAIVVEPGTYAENLEIAQDDVWILGSDPDDGADLAGILLQAPNPVAVRVDGAEGVVLHGLHIEGPEHAGILLHNARATVRATAVVDPAASADADGASGFGIYGTTAAGIILQTDFIILQRVAVTGAESVGILLQNVGVMMSDTDVSGSQAAGLRIESAPGTSMIEDSTFDGNREAGIGMYSSSAEILDNMVTGTGWGGSAYGADGVVVAELTIGGVGQGRAEVVAVGNQVSGCERAGIVVASGIDGRVAENTISHQGSAGIFIQGTAGETDTPLADGADGEALGILVEDNLVSDNTLHGIVVSKGARAHVRSNQVLRTIKEEIPVGRVNLEVGDGISVYAGAAARLGLNGFVESGRWDVVLDAPGDGTFVAEQAADMPQPPTIILQHVAETADVGWAPGVIVDEKGAGDEVPVSPVAQNGLLAIGADVSLTP